MTLQNLDTETRHNSVTAPVTLPSARVAFLALLARLSTPAGMMRRAPRYDLDEIRRVSAYRDQARACVDRLRMMGP